MLHSKKNLILAAALLSISATSISKEISYDYIQGTYISTSVDSGTTAGDVDGNGLGVAASFSVAPAIAVSASLGATSFDRFQGVDIDTAELTLGITAHTAIAPNTDVFGNFSVLRAGYEASDGFTTIDDTDTGNVISIGLRFLANDKVEIAVGAARTDIFDETSNSFGGSVRFYANEKFSLGIGYSTSDDADTLSLNARIDFK